jgi:hypothetical protein
MRKQVVKRIGLILLLILCLLPLSCSIITGESIGAEAQGLLLSQVIANGKLAAELNYDSNGKLVSINYVDYGTASFEYGPDGLLVKYHEQILGVSVDASYSYDSEGIITVAALDSSSGNVTMIYRVEFLKDTQGRLDKGLYFQNGEQIGYITYVYDGKGNTTGMTFYANDGSTSTQVFRFDDQINPYRQVLNPYIVQKNNVVYTRYEVSGGFIPQEYSATFEYNAAGLPVKEIRVDSYGANSTIEYVYISKNSLRD